MNHVTLLYAITDFYIHFFIQARVCLHNWSQKNGHLKLNLTASMTGQNVRLHVHKVYQ